MRKPGGLWAAAAKSEELVDKGLRIDLKDGLHVT